MQRCYLLVGDEFTWETSLQKSVWGFAERSVGLWNTTEVGDLLAFYVTKPIQKVIGFGIVKRKYEDSELVWRDERLFKRSIWKYKINFEEMYILSNWENGISVPNSIILNVGRKVIPKEVFISFVKDADSKWKTKLYSKFF